MKAFVFLLAVGLEAVVLLGLVGCSARETPDLRRARRDKVHLVKALQLTDLSLWTEARYTRHPSQADLASAFQDGPGMLEHFPAGMWVPTAGARNLRLPGEGTRR